MSIGCSGSFGSSSCAGNAAANTRTNGNAIQRIIARYHSTKLAETEAEMRARETGRSLDSRAMAFDDRPEIAAAGQSAHEQDSAPRAGRRPTDIKSVALTGLFVLATFYTMYFMRAMLLPLVLALLLSYLLVPLVRGLAHIKIRPLFGAAIVLIALISGIVYSVSLLSEPATGWIEKAPYSLQQLKQKLLPLKKPIEKVAQASGEIDKLTTTEEQQAKTQAVVVKRSALAEAFFTQGPEFVASAVVMFILLYFLLAYDGVFLAKIIRVMPRLGDKKKAVAMLRESIHSLTPQERGAIVQRVRSGANRPWWRRLWGPSNQRNF